MSTDTVAVRVADKVGLSLPKLALLTALTFLVAIAAMVLSLFLALTSAGSAREIAVQAVASDNANRVAREKADCELYELLVPRAEDPRTGEPRPLPDTDRGWAIGDGVRNVWITAGCSQLLAQGGVPLPVPPPVDDLRRGAR